jgi:pilus assembly protein CpaB
MARTRGPILVTLSLILGLGAAWLANNWMASHAVAKTPTGVHVVSAALEIPLGTRIEARHLASIEMLPGSQPRGSFQDKKALEGKVARADILPGEIILEARVAEQAGGSALAAVVSKNMRAITVRVDDVVGVGGFLLPGNRVDVLATKKKEGRDVDPITETILSNVKVLAVDQTAATDSADPVVVRAVTLEVTPEQAEVLTKGKAAGTIQLTLRNPLDDTVVAKKVAQVEKVVRVPVAKPRPAPAPTITVIRGTEIERDATKN